ncbi:transglutaminase-like domain-containing protein [Geomonas sp. Red32]|uniref:transglutaminase-like domain-containing protein n=1 Tax=Geomonas sp. Red32 TaxID=2912856 RepID=UPI00202CB861|nr:transglutaminase-like domain-containing protein [Geomonas sp. Red32]MCM0081090.1 transglutaminase-like domain-containing protein [Geomonas sp. Red32]
MKTRYLTLLLTVLLVLIPLQLLAASLPKLSAPPVGERWFTVSMGGERVGFAHLNITREGEGYRISSESGVKMKGLGFSREASAKESYLVRPDLALVSFFSDTVIDGSHLTVNGKVAANAIHATVQSRSGTKERTIKHKGVSYPPEALNIYPLMAGAVSGKSYKIPMLDLEALKVKQVKVKVIGQETLPSGLPAVHLSNDLYPIVDNDIWVDLKGNTVKEAVREDLVVTEAVDEATAKLQLADDALSKKDMVLDFSLVPVTPPLENPQGLKRLAVEVSGIPERYPLLQGQGQSATRLLDGSVRFVMPNPAPAPEGAPPAGTGLEATQRIPADAPQIVALKNEILVKESDPVAEVRLLAAWVAREIKGSGTDSQSPLETLEKKEGNCQSHARLYASLARAAGIPTRFVSGLVYLPERGFLYHSWAESYLNGWVPVDPTFGEVPADVTHIKLVEGDSAGEMEALAGVIGRIKIKVADKAY